MYSGVLIEFLNMGGGEIALIMVAILLLFGGKKLPELARGLGKGIREFKDASEGVKREIHRNINAVDLENELKEEDNSSSTSLVDDYSEPHHVSSYDEPMPSVEEENQITPEKVVKRKSNSKKNKAGGL